MFVTYSVETYIELFVDITYVMASFTYCPCCGPVVTFKPSYPSFISSVHFFFSLSPLGVVDVIIMWCHLLSEGRLSCLSSSCGVISSRKVGCGGCHRHVVSSPLGKSAVVDAIIMWCHLLSEGRLSWMSSSCCVISSRKVGCRGCHHHVVSSPLGRSAVVDVIIMWCHLLSEGRLSWMSSSRGVISSRKVGCRGCHHHVVSSPLGKSAVVDVIITWCHLLSEGRLSWMSSSCGVISSRKVVMDLQIFIFTSFEYFGPIHQCGSVITYTQSYLYLLVQFTFVMLPKYVFASLLLISSSQFPAVMIFRVAEYKYKCAVIYRLI